MGFFKLKEHNTNVATEFRAGLTTFITMIYIVPLNALILSQANMPYEALLSATVPLSLSYRACLTGYGQTPPSL